MKKDNHVDGFRSVNEVLRQYLEELYAKADNPENKSFIQEQIDILDNQSDTSNSNYIFAALRQNDDAENSPLYLDGLEKPWDRYKDQPLKFFIVMYLSGRRLHHAYVANRDKEANPTVWYFYFE